MITAGLQFIVFNLNGEKNTKFQLRRSDTTINYSYVDVQLKRLPVSCTTSVRSLLVTLGLVFP